MSSNELSYFVKGAEAPLIAGNRPTPGNIREEGKKKTIIARRERDLLDLWL